MNQAKGEETQTAVTVTFPSQDLIIDYYRPAPPDPLAFFEAVTRPVAGPTLVWLGNTPASYHQGARGSWGAIQFIVGGALIGVLGHTSEASLQAVAQSIVDRAPASPSDSLDAPRQPLLVMDNRTDGTLTSITVTASPSIPNASAAIEILGRPRGGPATLVYQQQVPLSAPSAAAPKQLPEWTGTISPNDWSGGCHPGWVYSVHLLAVGPGTSLADLMAEPPAKWGYDSKAEIDGIVVGRCGPTAGQMSH